MKSKNVLITHDYTSGDKNYIVQTDMSFHKLNLCVAWLQSELDKIEQATPLTEDYCADLLCKFYGCFSQESLDSWDKELNLCVNWDTYVCGPLCKARKPLIDACAKDEARDALKNIAIEMEKCRV
jgi:hypothetical protein